MGGSGGEKAASIKDYVDAQNTFGTQIRQYYVITVKHIDDYRYQLIKLEM